MRGHIVEMDVLVAPLEVVDNPFVRQFLLHDEDVLEEINYSLLDVEVVKLRNHCFLVFQIAFVLIDQGIPLVDHVSDVVKHRTVVASIHSCQLIGEILVLLLFFLKLNMHVLNLMVVSLEFPDDQLLVLPPTSKF